MIKNIDTFKSILQESLSYIGLDFKLYLDKSFSTPFSYCIGFSKTIELDILKGMDEISILDQIQIPIIDAVKNSPAVKAEKAELTKEVEQYKNTNSELQKEIQRLREFEKYYNLHYKLNHKSWKFWS